MKKLIYLIIALLILPIVFAATLPPLTEPYSKTLTSEGQFGKTWTTVKTELGVKSCYDKANYEAGNCDYVYWCYAILPATSTSIYDALSKECKEATRDTGIVSLAINKFVPPKGLPFYVTSFVTKVNYVYDKINVKWNEAAVIPNAYTTADQIRTICSEGQMLKLTPLGYQCYNATRVCIDSSGSGLCTNQYNIFALDLNRDGTISSLEVKDATNYCADRPTATSTGDGICDTTQDLGCLDTCSKWGTTSCTTPGANGICDIWDQLSTTACVDDVNSKNSKICDSLETGIGICPNHYDPVCYGGRGGITYPNSCFAKSLLQTPYITGACENPVTQCYVVEDCPDVNACVGGATPIAKACINRQCSYSGTCGELSCSTNTQCDILEANMCVGVDATCVNSKCQIQGKCITQPIPTQRSIWELLIGIFSAFFSFIKTLLGV